MKSRIAAILGALVLVLAIPGLVACTPAKGVDANQRVVTVTKGDLAVVVSASGNIKASREVRLSFGSNGKVNKVSVKEGDTVRKGDVLAKQDTELLELTVAQAELEVARANMALLRTGPELTQAELAVIEAQLAKQAAELDLKKAENIYKWPELEVAYAQVESARLSARYNSDRLSTAPPERQGELSKLQFFAEANIALAEDRLNAMLSSRDTDEVAIMKQRVEAAKQSLELSEQSVELTKESAGLAKQSVKAAERSLSVARKNLNDATIVALFDGIVAEVGAKEGDMVTPAVAVVHLVDTAGLELVVEIDEMDMPRVKVGQQSVITVDAIPNRKLTGNVTSILPLPKAATGLVTYNVRIESEMLREAGVMVGMNASTDIEVDKRSNVLLVPSQAITKNGNGKRWVKVVVDDKVEEREVVTGVSNASQTEIKSGLTEGEKIIVEAAGTKPSEG